jgi:hypothetical protein
MNDAATSLASPGWPRWLRSVAAVALVAFLGYLPLGVVAVVGAFTGLAELARPLWILYNCLFPFLFLRQASQTDGSGITDFPVAATIAQWIILAGLNVVLAQLGISKRPFLSALLLAGFFAALSLAAVSSFDLRYQEIRT